MPVGKYESYVELFSKVPGWFEPQAIALWDAFLTYQEEAGVVGDLLEIGVWKGKSAGMLALHCKPHETVILIDINSLDATLETLAKAVPGTTCVPVIEPSIKFKRTPLYHSLKRSVRWMHIDGGHSFKDAADDLDMAETLLNDAGVVVVDDFFSPAYPQVTQAVFLMMEKYPKRFVLILVGFNKAFLCRRKAAPSYLTFIKESLYDRMAERGWGEVTFWKTNTAQELNAFGVSHRLPEAGNYRGLDTNHADVPI